MEETARRWELNNRDMPHRRQPQGSIPRLFDHNTSFVGLSLHYRSILISIGSRELQGTEVSTNRNVFVPLNFPSSCIATPRTVSP
jgi:hypothetical protein